jgi:hypothetical protein
MWFLSTAMSLGTSTPSFGGSPSSGSGGVMKSSSTLVPSMSARPIDSMAAFAQ